MWIEDTKTLEEAARRLEEAGAFALDTEFIRERTYRPRLCLVQLATADFAAALDPLQLTDLEPLLDLIFDPRLEKIVHAGQQDMEIFYARTGRTPRNVFDTQVAAAMVGLGAGIGYSRLVGDVLGIKLKKAHTFTDWARRPLSSQQVEYAIDDVRHLPALREKLGADLESLDRVSWLREELRVYEDESHYSPDRRRLYERLRGAGKLDPRELAVLRELADWREEEAEARDRPRGRILSDGILIELARRAPKDWESLSGFRGLHSKQLRHIGRALLERIERGLSVPRAERPARLDRGAREPRHDLAVELLDTFLKARAEELRIAPGYLASRKELQQLASGVLSGDGDPDLPILRGWRGEKVGADLVNLLSGRVSLAVEPRTAGIVLRPAEPVSPPPPAS